jgi:hypothetical protein
VNPWQTLVHGTGSDYTGHPGHIVPYSFWSGVAGSFATNAIAFFLLWYLHHTCPSAWWCWRFAKYPAAGGAVKTCRHHHPDLKGEKPRGPLIERLHAEYMDALRFCGADHRE